MSEFAIAFLAAIIICGVFRTTMGQVILRDQGKWTFQIRRFDEQDDIVVARVNDALDIGYISGRKEAAAEIERLRKELEEVQEEANELVVRQYEVSAKTAEIERLRLSISEASATGRREGLSEAAKIAAEYAEYIEGVGKKHPEDSPSRDRCFARAKSCLAIAAAIRAAMEK